MLARLATIAALALAFAPASALALVPQAQAVNVMEAPWNAKCDGTTDDAAAIQSALNAKQAVSLPANRTCVIKSTLTAARSNVQLLCQTGPASAISATQGTPAVAPCRLLWNGASGGIMMTIIAPTGATSKVAIAGNGVRGVSFDGNNGLAKKGLYAATVVGGEYTNLYFVGFNSATPFTDFAFDLTSNPAANHTNFSQHVDSQMNHVENISINQSAWTAGGLELGSFVEGNGTGSNVGGNASENLLMNIDIVSTTGPGLVCNGCDNNLIMNLRSSPQGGGHGNALEFKIYSNGTITFPANGNVVVHMSGTGNSSVKAEGNTALPGCTVYTGGIPGFGWCTTNNTVMLADYGNGMPGPTIEAGAQLNFSFTSGYQVNAVGGPTGFGDTAVQALFAQSLIGTATIYARNGSGSPIVIDDEASHSAKFAMDGANPQIAPVIGGGTFLEVPGVKVGLSATCNTTSKGTFWIVTDGVATPSKNQAYAGGGSTTEPVFCNGSSLVYP
jgi:hypothetical protein